MGKIRQWDKSLDLQAVKKSKSNIDSLRIEDSEGSSLDPQKQKYFI